MMVSPGVTLTFFLLSILICCTSSKRKIPSYIELCHRDDPEINACFMKAVSVIQPRMTDGIPDLFIPPLNPLRLTEVSLDNGQTFKASFKDIEIYHAQNFQLKNVDVNIKENMVEATIFIPHMRIKSNYTIEGRILVLRLNGQGPADGNFTDVTARMIVKGSRYMKNGKEFLKFENDTLEADLGKPVFQFDNLFRENRELNEQTNRVVNENIGDIIDELKPVINKAVSEITIGIIHRLFDFYSLDELLPK